MTSDGPPDGEKWYTLWKLSAAVVKLCVSGSGRAGIAYDSGKCTDPDPFYYLVFLRADNYF